MSKVTPALFSALVVISGCAGERGGALDVPVDREGPRAGAEQAPDPAAELPNSKASTPQILGPDALVTSFDEVSAGLSGQVGVAIAGDQGVRVLGLWNQGPAWSTVKVPLAIAGLRKSQDAAKPYVAPAIKESNNDAAEAIWSQLGTTDEAAAAVQAVLRDGGDSETVVQSERVRPGYTPFGQSIWSLADQAQFAASLPCVEGSQIVLDDMRNLGANQQWGLALREDSAAKGGWGPSEHGTYLVRQLSVIATPSGSLGIALSAVPNDGTFETGVAQIGKLAEWVNNHLGSFSGQRCD
jgi:hypothetical protein